MTFEIDPEELLSREIDAAHIHQTLLERLLAQTSEQSLKIAGIGTDILFEQRVADTYQRHGDRFANRILTVAEREQFQNKNEAKRINFLAKRYSIKEAASKALGTGIGDGVSFQHMEVVYSELGQPELLLSDVALEKAGLLGGEKMLLSVTDDHGMIVAFALLV